MHFQTQVIQVDSGYLSVYHLSTDPCLWTSLPRKQTVFSTRIKNIKWLWSLVCCLMIYLHLSEFVDCSGSGWSPSIVVSDVSRHKKPLPQSPVYVLTLMSLCTLPLSPRPQHLFISVDRHCSQVDVFSLPPSTPTPPFLQYSEKVV